MNQPRVIALGFFDGVHLGHGELLKACRSMADDLGVKAACLTFDLHPDALLSGKPVELLTDPSARAQIMKERYGMDEVLTLHFDRALMNMDWRDFIEKILRREFGAAALVCGHDFRFGKGGEGNAMKLREACPDLEVRVIPAFQLDGITVSSTYIRSLALAGDMERAERFLGHPFTLRGEVVPGAHLGRQLGTPTANLSLPANQLLPARGVYACLAHTPYGKYAAVANIGTRPTVDGVGVTVEPWLLDFQRDLYGAEVTLELRRFLRGERKFPDLDALAAEIRHNAAQTRAFFEEEKSQ